MHRAATSSARTLLLSYRSRATMEARRCNIHGLVASDDGRCIICRRGDPSADDPSIPQPLSSGVIVLALGALAMGGIFAFWITRPVPKQLVLIDQPKIEAPPPPPAPEPPPPPRRLEPRSDPTVEPPNAQAQDLAPADPNAEDPKLTLAKQRVPIKMYFTSACIYCPQARAWLAQHRYRYTELDIDQSDTDRVEMQALNPAMTVPTFDIGGVAVVGFNPQTIDSTLTRVATAKR